MNLGKSPNNRNFISLPVKLGSNMSIVGEGKETPREALLGEAGQGTPRCWRKCPGLHHIPNKQVTSANALFSIGLTLIFVGLKT